MQIDDTDNTFMSDRTAQIYAVLLAIATIPLTHKSLLEATTAEREGHRRPDAFEDAEAAT